jgi:hypothetical protein
MRAIASRTLIRGGLIGLAVALTAGAVPARAGGPTPVFAGAGTSVAVEPSTGRVAVARDGRLEIFASVDAAKPTSVLDLPNATARMVEFRADIVVFSFTLTDEPGLHLMAMDTSGRERLVWPNEGIGATFPTESSRLTLDGRGLYGVLTLDDAVRAELGIPSSVPAGAGVVVTYKFSSERMLTRFSEAFHSAVALSCEDLVIAWHDGTVIRYASPGGIVWKKDYAAAKDAVVADVDPEAGTAVCLGPNGELVALDLATGAIRWRGEPLAGARAARLLHDGRVLILAADKALALYDPRSGRLVADDLTTGLGAVGSWWKERAADLRSFFEVVPGSRPELLFAGADGWYATPLP